MNRNVKADYVFCFLKNFDISNAVWVLYLIYRGLPLWQVGLVEGIFHLASFVFEVPSGALADLFGRKQVMVLGRICYVLAAAVQLVSKSFWQFGIAFVILALSYNLNSGSEEALVYDSMKMLKEEGKYLKVNSWLNVIAEVGGSIATVIGGVLAQRSYALCYGTIVVIGMCSMLPLAAMTEPEIAEKGKEKKRISLKEHFGICAGLIRGNPKLVKVLIYYPMVSAFATVVYFYGQEFFSQMGLDKVQISLVMLLEGVASCIGALISEAVMNHLRGATKYAASLCMGIGILLVSMGGLAVSILGFCLVGGSRSMLYPVESLLINQETPSAQRATILSVDSMCFSLAMICIFPLNGAIATVWGLGNTFFLLGIVQLLLMVLLPQRGKKS